MILADRSIREALATGELIIHPLNDDDIQPASVDLHLAGQVQQIIGALEIDPQKPHDHAMMTFDNTYHLGSGQFVLGHTVEFIKIPDYLVARIEGKSSIGRLGLTVHSTAGYVDPGFRGQLTLEIKNNTDRMIRLYNGMKIAQLSFLQMTAAAERPYGSKGLRSKYQDQVGAVGSRYYQEFV